MGAELWDITIALGILAGVALGCWRAYRAGKAGGTAPAVLNAANEEAVSLFLQEKVPFVRIFDLVREALDKHSVQPMDTLETVLAADRWARDFVRHQVE